MLFTVEEKKPLFHFSPFGGKKNGTNPRTPNPFTTKGEKKFFGTLKRKKFRRGKIMKRRFKKKIKK